MVGRRERIGIPKIDLMLPVRDFVMCRFHLESHLLQRRYNRPPSILAQIGGRHVEVTPHVVRHGSRFPLLARLEHEELGLHSRVHYESHGRRTADLPLEHRPRIARKRRPIRHVDIAD